MIVSDVLAVCICMYIFADYFEVARKILDCTTPGLVTSPYVAEKCFATELSKDKAKSLNVSEQTEPSDYVTQPKHNNLQRFQARIVSGLKIPICFTNIRS